MKFQQWLFIIVIFNFGVEIKGDNNIDDCIRKDSLSCLQLQMFQKVRDMMDQPVIDLFGGISLVKNSNRSEKSVTMENLAERVENATDVMSRQTAIENYLIRKTRDVMFERVIRWNAGDAVQGLAKSLSSIFNFKKSGAAVTVGRGKGKKLVKFLVPLLIGLKLTMAAVSALTFLGVVVLAKKAILSGLISLLVSGIIGLQKFLAPKQAPYSDGPASYGLPTWNSGVPPGIPGPWPVYEGAAESPIPQHILYANHKSS